MGDAAGVGNATSGSLTDRLTREHRMTADEARLILNAKREDGLENILRVSLLAILFSISDIALSRITSTSSKLIHLHPHPKSPFLVDRNHNTTLIICNLRFFVQKNG